MPQPFRTITLSRTGGVRVNIAQITHYGPDKDGDGCWINLESGQQIDVVESIDEIERLIQIARLG